MPEDSQLMNFSFVSNTVSDLREIANSILSRFPEERIFAIYGNLGVGKTELVKEFCRELGVDQQPLSPSYSLINEYSSAKTPCFIYHMDLYRLNDIIEFYDIGYEEYFYGNGICFIEWPEIIETLLPPNYVEIKIIRPNPGKEIRTLSIKKH